MASDIRPPADHSHLFSDPAELARLHDREADVQFRVGSYELAEYHQQWTIFYRRQAALGEQVPEF